jgi:hypothetical protein
MQTLYDAVRGTGAQNLVLVPGLDWAYDLSGVVSGYALSGANIAYDTHIYTKYHSTTSDWDQHFGAVAAQYPVTATELGTTDCSSDQTKALLQYLYAPDGNGSDRIGWTIWGWSAPGECDQPSVLSDWGGSPLSSQGQLVHDMLAWLASQPTGSSSSSAGPAAGGGGSSGGGSGGTRAPAPDAAASQTGPVARSGPGRHSHRRHRRRMRRTRRGGRQSHRAHHHRRERHHGSTHHHRRHQS